MKAYLAKIGLDYTAWQASHWRSRVDQTHSKHVKTMHIISQTLYYILYHIITLSFFRHFLNENE